MAIFTDILPNFNNTYPGGNIIAGSFVYSEIDRAESPNIVRATFVDSENNFQKTVAQVEDEPNQDNRGGVIQDVDLLGVASRNQAIRLANIQLMKSCLSEFVCSFRVSINDCDVSVGDLVTVTHTVPGWSLKTFVVTKTVETQNDEIDLTLEEYIEAAFSDGGKGATYIEYPSEPNPVTVRPPTDFPDLHRITWSTDSKAVWTAGTIYYKGIGYEIDAGDTTDAFIWFDPGTSTTALQHGAAAPAITTDIWVLAYYTVGTDTIDQAFMSKIINAKFIKASSITTSELSFTPLISAGATGAIVATINASAEGIEIDADNFTVTGSTVFTAKVGGTYTSAAGAVAKVNIFPDANTGIQCINAAQDDVFRVYVGGVGDPGSGDVIIGSTTGAHVKWDNSVPSLTFTTGSTAQRIVISSANNSLYFYNTDNHLVSYLTAASESATCADMNLGLGYGGRLIVYNDSNNQINLVSVPQVGTFTKCTTLAISSAQSGGVTSRGIIDVYDTSVGGIATSFMNFYSTVLTKDVFTVTAAGSITLNGTVDGVDIAAHAGGTGAVHGNCTAAVAGFMTAAQYTKLDGIEAAADVTDATNVAAAGACMDGDFASAGFMKTDGAGTYSVAADGSDTDFSVVTDVRLYIETGVRYLEKKTRALTLDNGLITVVGAESGWTSAGNDS